MYWKSIILQWFKDSTEQSNGKTGDWAFPKSRNKTLTFPVAFTTCYVVLPSALLNSPTGSNPSINLGAFYRAPTASNFIHYSSISWEQTVKWYAVYIALGKK